MDFLLLKEAICRAVDGQGAAVEYVSVNHGRADVTVTKKLLDGSDVVAIFQEVGGEGVPEGMAAGGFGDAGFLDGLPDGPLDDRFV